MKRSLTLLTALALTTALAASQVDRVLKFNTDFNVQGNLRNGPINYTGKNNATIKASVNNVQISAPKAVQVAPAGLAMAQAEGKRVATFSGGVSVVRGRLQAKGEQLAYSESTGQGVMTGTPSAVFVPDKEKGDPVNIKATQMSLDIDNNQSTSTGSVQLASGNQTGKADKLVFDEDKEVGVMTGNPSMSRAATAKQKELVITGTEARVVTKGKLLYVKGKVKLVQGTSTTTGDAVYYDDKANVAYVVGNAVSVDSKAGTTVKAVATGYLEQRTDLGRVRVLTKPFTIPTAQFQLSGEK
jgi:lipopolysaccharide transport protein LptA